MEQINIQFWAWVYRLTGWYSPVARYYEYKHIKSRIKEIEDMYTHESNDMDLEDVVGLEVGMWQANHGFYRKFKGVANG